MVLAVPVWPRGERERGESKRELNKPNVLLTEGKEQPWRRHLQTDRSKWVRSGRCPPPGQQPCRGMDSPRRPAYLSLTSTTSASLQCRNTQGRILLRAKKRPGKTTAPQAKTCNILPARFPPPTAACTPHSVRRDSRPFTCSLRAFSWVRPRLADSSADSSSPTSTHSRRDGGASAAAAAPPSSDSRGHAELYTGSVRIRVGRD